MIELRFRKAPVLCFDLDDTLYKEIDFLKSAYREIAQKISKSKWFEIYTEMLELYRLKKNVFEIVCNKYGGSDFTIEMLLKLYRNHIPDISLDEATSLFLSAIKNANIKTAIITDGRSLTQRNKISSLGLLNYFDKVVISEEINSEKPAMRNFKVVEESFREQEFVYFADNFKKDFITPNKLGWATVAIKDDGKNIHKLTPQGLEKEYLPKYIIDSFSEITINVPV